jgi:hypothetical protein
MQVLGHQRFTQLHHLVAVFLQVIGIEAHAKPVRCAPRGAACRRWREA